MLNDKTIGNLFNQMLLARTEQTDNIGIQVLQKIQQIMRTKSPNLWKGMMSLMVLQPASLPSLALCEYIIQQLSINEITGIKTKYIPEIESEHLLPIIKQLINTNNGIDYIMSRLKANSTPLFELINNVSALEKKMYNDMIKGISIPLFPPGYICFNHTYAMITALITKKIDIFKM